MSNDAEVRARTIAGEAVNGLQMDKVQREARQRMMKDMCGGFYDEHLARTLADHLASTIAIAFAAEARSHDGEWEAIETAPKDGSWFLTYTPGESSYGPCDFAMYDVEFGDFCKDRCGFQYVTHWMRLPAPPMSAVPLFDEGRL